MIPLVAPTITAKDRNSVCGAIRAGALKSDRYLREYEEAFAARVGCAGAVAVCSGTTALALVAEVLQLRWERVTIPTYTCSALANASGILERRVPGRCLADGTFDVKSARMTQRVATVKVHAFGNNTVDDPRDLLNASLIEDYTLSLGAVQPLWAKVGVCSTHASKMLSTGRGGIVFSNDQALLDEVRSLAYYDDEPNGRLGAYSLGMTSMQAALGLSQLRQLDDFIYRRRAIAGRYTYAFEPAGIECPAIGTGSVFFRYIIGVDDPAAKVAALADHGIQAGRGVFPPLHRQLGLPDADFPGATWCVDHLLSVPVHPSLTDEQVKYIAEHVVRICSAQGESGLGQAGHGVAGQGEAL